MRKVVLVVVAFAGLLSGPAMADGFWTGNESVRTYPIESVLDQAVPKDDCWKIQLSESLRGKSVTAPPTGMSWRDRLQTMAHANHLTVSVRDSDCIVSVTPYRDGATVASALPGRYNAAPPPPAPTAAPDPNRVDLSRGFALAAGGTLRAQVDRWAKASGWHLEWKLSYDYPVTVAATFGTELYQAVTNLVSSYERVGQMRDVEWVFNKGNKVLVVREVDRFTQAKRQAPAPAAN
ncbi:hypothetical protein E4T66_17960 [Sinimarinibacterium sp. CAU 1509]|uniref:TcpQ domain-containing protein n=1 Tax=Sinimarinibacterium sp. CAU 1509 TaxID=2562283 RepID=UPI0010AC870A|nr:TcpQ domain-containing protein [Sinimarinibacterium sp. CAU 1509]TJY57291.1 hypothetical protein E4T66_17960 [Sinimarinibacterium sp. CAU 1509]